MDNSNNEDYKKLVMVLCHDLNNSIGIVKNSLKLIPKMGDHPHPKFTKTMEKISRAVENMNDLLQSVKDYESIKSGKKELELENLSFDKIIKDAEFSFHDKAEEKKVKLEFINNIPADHFIKAEDISFKNSVINNLLSNAIKFSKEGDTVTLKGEIEGEKIKITVTDQGIGIPDALKEKIFNPSLKTTRNGTSGEKGTGFGMPLVKTYVNQFSGDIEIVTRDISTHPEDHGTSMVMTFPISK